MKGTTYIDNFINDSLITYLLDLDYDKSMKSRYTKSFGIPYNYSQIEYDVEPIPNIFDELISKIETELKFKPNNILINYYLDGESKMGYHSDDVVNLKDDTGVCIISLGNERILRFKHKETQDIIDFNLKSGSLFYMNKDIQNEWLHSIPKSETNDFRFSLTFREINI